jgi:phosphatidate cytidylyltransferase
MARHALIQRLWTAAFLLPTAVLLLAYGDLMLIFALLILVFWLDLEWRGLHPKQPWHDRWPVLGLLSFRMLGLVWIAWGLAGMVGLLWLDRKAALWFCAVIWATDSGAYVAGRWLGGAKLAPSISPNKTRSGALGGWLTAALLAVWLREWYEIETGWMRDPWVTAAVAVVVSTVSQLGDLLESWVKRQAGCKDSGRLLPGHGGLWDRVDGLWTAAPVAALCLVWLW